MRTARIGGVAPGDKMFEDYLGRWDLAVGTPVSTMSSDLLSVTRGAATPAMLKVAREAEEQRGNRLMAWWDGRGAAPVLAQDGSALLMARAQGDRSLARMALVGDDDGASRILCAVAARLHSCEGRPPFELVPLADWFSPLTAPGSRHEGIIDLAAVTARELLEHQSEVVVLHGDIHHRNVLDFGQEGWLAIDPKGLIGERTFDFVNILRNPDPRLALAPGRLSRQASLISFEAELDRVRLLRWLLAFSGLSAVWLMEEGDEPDLGTKIAQITAAELGLSQ